MKATVGLLLVALLTAPALWAQGNFGSITGAVSDQSGAAVPGADVRALNMASGLELFTRSTTAGNYLIPNVPTGQYSVTVAAPAFKTFRRQPVLVSTASTTTVNATLEVGAITETITVEEASTQVDAATSSVGTVISEQVFNKIPFDITGMGGIGIRQPQQFIYLVPGVTGDATTYRVNGGQGNSQSLQIDGHNWALINNPGRMATWPPPFEAIEEFKLNASQFSAENPVGSATTQFTIKSGTDNWHGSFSHLLRNDHLNARGFFARQTSPLKLHESVVTLGGPIVKGRTHFFASLTRYSRRGRDNAAQLISVPTPAFKRGDFSQWVDARGALIPIYDPATTRDNGRGGFTRTAFPNNTIPANRIGPVGRNGAGLMPDPILPGVLNNHVIIGQNKENIWLPNAKIDHSWTPSQISRVTYFGTHRRRAVFDGYPGPLGPGDTSFFVNHNIMASHTSVVSPTVVNEARWSLAPWIGPQINEGIFPESGTEVLGIPNHPSLPGVTPRISITNLTPVLGNGNRQPFDSERRHFSFGDTLSWVRGRHQWKFGFTGIISKDDTTRGLNYLGTFNFSNRSTSQPEAANVGALGHGFASFLLGDVFTANRLHFNDDERERMRRLEMFIQDDFKITRRLTLNLGVNYHIPFPFVDGENNISALDLSLPNPAADGRPGALIFAGDGPGRTGRRALADTYYRAFAPRFGFAYALNDRTAVRGGYGIFYAYAPVHTTVNGSPREGFTFVQDVQTLDQGITPAFNINNGFPRVNVQLPRLDPALKNGSSAIYVHPDSRRPPYLQQWSLGVQKELPWRLFLDASYVGNKGTRLASQLENINQLDPRLLSLESLLNQNINSAAAQAAGIGRPFSRFIGTVGQSLRPYPQFTTISNLFQSTGYSSYHSLQVKFERRLASGLMFLNAYTLSKLIDTGGNTQANQDPVAMDTFNRNLEKALSSDDRTHTFVTSFIYELPFGPRQKWLSNDRVIGNVLGNWRLGASLRYLSGSPLTITSSQALPLFGGANRPHLSPNVPLQTFAGEFDPARDRWLNRDAFSDPAPFTFGSVGRTLPNGRAPWFFNENLSLTKLVMVREGHHVEARVTLLNAFNRVVFGDPNTQVGNPNFGRITSQANLPREIMLELKCQF
jgi:hypothetical protein